MRVYDIYQMAISYFFFLFFRRHHRCYRLFLLFCFYSFRFERVRWYLFYVNKNGFELLFSGVFNVPLDTCYLSSAHYGHDSDSLQLIEKCVQNWVLFFFFFLNAIIHFISFAVSSNLQNLSILNRERAQVNA